MARTGAASGSSSHPTDASATRYARHRLWLIDLIPVRDRGFAAAVPAGLAFFIAALYPQEWRIEQFSAVMAVAMAPAAMALAVLALVTPLLLSAARVRTLARQEAP